MRSLRYNIEVKDGVRAEMLFTPHLYSFRGRCGITFELAEGENEKAGVCGIYADIMYCAALNAFVLDGHGNEEEFTLTRGDFHEFMAADPENFWKAVDFALLALTGKGLKDYVEKKEGKTEEEKPEDGGKKKVRSSWIGRLLRRFSSASAE